MNNAGTCLFCGAGEIAECKILPIRFNEKIFTWHKCRNCDLVFLWPALSDSDKEKMYGQKYHDKYYFQYTENYSKQLSLIEGYNKKSFLDFGCGDAGLLSLLQKNNFITTGVEYDKELVEKLSAKFTATKFIQEKNFWNSGETYDIIHLGDVLEHVSDPAGLLQQLKAKLNKDGLFFIEGPLECNPCLGYYFRKCTSFIRYIINKESTRVEFPYHITYSNAKNQQLFFDKMQLEKKYFKITEAGWPYIDTIKEIRSPWLLVQYLVSKISAACSALVPGFGNRFIYIGQPK